MNIKKTTASVANFPILADICRALNVDVDGVRSIRVDITAGNPIVFYIERFATEEDSASIVELAKHPDVVVVE